MNSQTFGEKIKELREKYNYSLKYVGEQISYNAPSLSKVEKNQRTAPERIVLPLAKLFQVDYKNLMLKYLSEKLFYEIKSYDFSKEIIKVVERRLEKERRGTQKIKKREEIINSIKSYFNTKPIDKAWIFGSFARGTKVSFDSDIDILVKFKKPNKITLFDIIEMKNDLADKTGREIDLVEEGQELKSFSKTIKEEKILVYGE